MTKTENSKKPVEEESASIVDLFKYLKEYTWPIVCTAIFLVGGRVAATLDPVWIKKIIDEITAGSPIEVIWRLALVYFGLRILSAIFDYLRDLIFANAEMGISRTLSRELFAKLLELPVQYYQDQRVGGLSRQITRGGRAVTFILDFMVINILPTIVELIIVAVLLSILYPPAYALITVGTIIVYTWFTMWSTEKRQKFRVAANTADDQVAGIEVDAISSIETIKYFNNEGVMKRRYWPVTEDRYNLSVSSNKLFALISAGQALILLIGLGSILLLAIRQTVSGFLTIGDLVLLTTYIARLAAPIGTLGFVYRGIKDGLADLTGMAKILKIDSSLPEPKYPVVIEQPKGQVAFENVEFSYESRVVLKDISFVAEPGTQVAFVGPSGAGKSTIIKLLFRLFEVNQGRVAIDGIDVKELAKKSRQEMLAIVPQEPVLFNSTIAENISFGNPDATLEQIIAATKVAHIHQFIDSLPEKYETMVGERGVKLSGGEKQRVAIARAVVRDPRILVFDEATSSLDTASEQQIQEALNDAAKGRTTLAIAHRLSTVVNFDQIYVIDKGEIVENGTHQELLKLGGVYAKLWRLQAQSHHE